VRRRTRPPDRKDTRNHGQVYRFRLSRTRGGTRVAYQAAGAGKPASPRRVAVSKKRSLPGLLGPLCSLKRPRISDLPNRVIGLYSDLLMFLSRDAVYNRHNID